MSDSVSDILKNVTIRNASNEDSDAVLALVASVLAEYGMEVDTTTTDRDLLNIEESYEKRGGHLEVIVDQTGRIVGSIGIYVCSDKTCELRKMYLIPELRGRGMGRYLLERVIARARELGFEQLVLETSSKLQVANRLYTHFGFQQIVPDHLSARADQAYSLKL